jgi:hypothetical protein
MSILSAIGNSHCGGPARVLAQQRWRKAAQEAVGQLDVEGKGRVLPRKSGAHSKPRTHDFLAKAGDLELPLLQPWQHETCDP